MNGKDIVVGVGVEKNGHVIIQTEEEMLPTEVMQQILDNVIAKIIHMNGDKSLINELAEKNRECNTWRWIAILQLGIFVICILKAKGVI